MTAHPENTHFSKQTSAKATLASAAIHRSKNKTRPNLTWVAVVPNKKAPRQVQAAIRQHVMLRFSSDRRRRRKELKLVSEEDSGKLTPNKLNIKIK
jgi:hypothetical protein